MRDRVIIEDKIRVFDLFDKVDKMIEEEFRKHSLVSRVEVVEAPIPSIRGEFSTRLSIDEKLDDIESIRGEVSRCVNDIAYEEASRIILGGENNGRL